ncbi:MAG: glycosyltransferase [Acidiferrobacterales bacterium]
MTELPVDQDRSPKASVILWNCGFRERFHAIKAYLNQSLPADQYEVLWVEYYDSVRPEVAEFDKKHENFYVVTMKKRGQWQFGVCINEGARLAKGSVLIISDGDVVVDERFVSDAIDKHAEMAQLVNYFRRYEEPHEPDEYYDDLEYLKRVCVLSNPSNYGGCFSIERKNFIALNGYEEDVAFAGPSACAKDAYVRFKNAGYLVRWDPEPRVFHPWHPGTAPTWVYFLSDQERIIRKRELDVSIYPNIGYSNELNRSSGDFDRVEAAGLKRKAKELTRELILRLVY